MNEAGRADPGARVEPHSRAARSAADGRTGPSGGAELARRRGADVPVVIRASDDHGLGQIELQMKIEERARHTPVQDRSGRRLGRRRETVDRFRRRRDHQRGPPVPPAVARRQSGPARRCCVRAVARDKRRLTDWGLDLGPQESGHAVARDQNRRRGGGSSDGRAGPARRPARGALETAGKAVAGPFGRRRAGGRHAGKSGTGALRARHAAPTRIRVTGIRARQIEIQRTAAELARSIAPADGAEPRTVRQALDALGRRRACSKRLPAATKC